MGNFELQRRQIIRHQRIVIGIFNLDPYLRDDFTVQSEYYTGLEVATACVQTADASQVG